MTHFSKETWHNYVLDLLSDEERNLAEQHLYECDLCLTHYMEIIEEQNENLPMMHEDSFTDEVMKQITFKNVELEEKENSKKQTKRLKSTFIHYIIATAATLIFMASGLFHYIFMMTLNFEQSSKQSEVPISKQFLDKTINVTKKIDSKTNGGSKHE
ncbi:hypothetical protein QUF88_10800 [Bacillus sp. DX1.1]|uniref:hypothetical protein n=1 Tax=unclassified Bacillus (in: firmicutes) TaxID=185979 RepID=UPI0025708D4C|nr:MULTISPECIES: hypothetical protein [unclassified Bacillus (in: firmicutes)]MDM5154307.1 hypothetical protein [Bacillus sp. DX1.1]WJE83221.1 hypothetical protein QRE67_08305 [Bacillus sp. DX3.1]